MVMIDTIINQENYILIFLENIGYFGGQSFPDMKVNHQNSQL